MMGSKKSGTGALILFFIMAVSLIAVEAGAQQQIEFSSTLNPVGSGARATGMGGAFISVADDATAASWNPAGLVQLEKPEVSAVYSYFNRNQEFDSKIHPEVGSEHGTDTHALNYASAAYPFVLFNRNMIVSLNYQRLYEMKKFTRFNFLESTGDGPISQVAEFSQSGHLYALAPAFAVQIKPGLAVGATFNIWNDTVGTNGWNSTQKNTLHANLFDGFVVSDEQIIEKKKTTFKGYNANFGLHWGFTDKLTLGLVYKTAFDADLVEKTTGRNSQTLYSGGNLVSSDTTHYSSRQKRTMYMPASYGAGISYRHSDAWTVAADLYRTDWSRFALKNEDGSRTNPLNKRPLSEGRLTDTTQVRLGTEYLFIKEKYVIPVRFGLFYDPEPAMKSPDDFYGFSIGTGYARGRVAFDMSYQYRFGKNVTTDVPALRGSDLDVRQHTLMASLIFYLK